MSGYPAYKLTVDRSANRPITFEMEDGEHVAAEDDEDVLKIQG